MKSKTLWFALILAVLGVIQTMTSAFEPFMSAKVYGLFTVVVAVVVAVLRILTTQAVTDK